MPLTLQEFQSLHLRLLQGRSRHAVSPLSPLECQLHQSFLRRHRPTTSPLARIAPNLALCLALLGNSSLLLTIGLTLPTPSSTGPFAALNFLYSLAFLLISTLPLLAAAPFAIISITNSPHLKLPYAALALCTFVPLLILILRLQIGFAHFYR